MARFHEWAANDPQVNDVSRPLVMVYGLGFEPHNPNKEDQ